MKRRVKNTEIKQKSEIYLTPGIKPDKNVRTNKTGAGSLAMPRPRLNNSKAHFTVDDILLFPHFPHCPGLAFDEKL